MNYVDPKYDKGFEVKNFLQLPKTNILIVNTVQMEYQNETSTQGETINVIKRKFISKLIHPFHLIFLTKAEYVIICMNYLQDKDKILITNYSQIIIADSYTLQSIKTISNSLTYHSIIIPNTLFVLITLKYSQISIFNIFEGNVIEITDLTQYIGDAQQYVSQLYKFNCQKGLVVLSSNQDGIISLNIDESFNQNTTRYIKYLGKVYLSKTITLQINQFKLKMKYFFNNAGENKVQDYYRRFTKHPTQDIIFMTGDNLEIIAIKVINFVDNQYKEMKNISDKFKNSNNKLITNIIFSEIQNSLIVGDNNNIYHLDLQIDFENETITFPVNFNQKELKNEYEFYIIQEGLPLIVISQQISFTIYDQKNKLYTQFFSKLKTLIFLKSLLFFFLIEYREKQNLKSYMSYIGNQEVIVMAKENQLQLIKRDDLSGDYISIDAKFSYNILQKSNNFYKVKKCLDCLLIKARLIGQSDYIITTKIQLDKMKYTEKIIFQTQYLQIKEQNITTSFYDFKWEQLNDNLDPFKFNDTIWITVAFPNKQKIIQDVSALFYLINAEDTNLFYPLVHSNPEINKRNTTFATYIDDVKNPEIIGVDSIGSIHGWDLSSTNFKYKYYGEIGNININTLNVLIQGN